MEALQQARLLYKQRYQQQGLAFLSDLHTYQLEAKIQRYIEIAIKEVPSVILFQTPDYLNVFERALKYHTKATSDLTALAKAYESLEKYFLLLIEQPWKREFKKIKLYGGFYRTRIKSALPEPESIFGHAGYLLQLDKQVLVLESPVQIDNVLMIAFDSRLCREQCQAITDHYEVVKGLSVSLDEAVKEILYSDRSRGRPGVFFLPPASEPSRSQGNFQPLEDGAEKAKGYVTFSSSSGPPHIPKREPIEKSSGMREPIEKSSGMRFPPPREPIDPPMQLQKRKVERQPDVFEGTLGYMTPEEAFDPLMQLQNFKVEREPIHFEGAMDEHLLRGLQAVGQLQYQPQEATTFTPKNGHVDPNEWDAYYQLQMQRKRDKNQFSGGEIKSKPSALHNATVTTQGFPYQTNMPGVQKLSIMDSFDEGIEKDLSPVSKSSRDLSVRYPSVSLKSGFHQGVTSTTKLPSSNLQPSIADQGYNTAYGSNGHTPIPSPGSNTQMLQQQQQQPQLLGNGIYADGVMSPPIGPPPIPPRALKPDFGMKGQTAAPPKDVIFTYPSSSSLQHKAVGQNSLSQADFVNTDPATGAMSSNSLVSSSSSQSPMLSPKLSTSGPIFHKGGQHAVIGKSSSLKYNAPGTANGGTSTSSLLQQSQRNRGARSMDLSRLEWQCHRCTTRNLSSDTVCSVCAASRLKSAVTAADGLAGSFPGHLDPLVSDAVPGRSKKPCPACTLENEPDRAHCALCEAKLEDPFTYV